MLNTYFLLFMKITTSTVTKLSISELDKLDPITVILEDIEPSKGKIIIECYGQSWSGYWSGMGERTIAQFFCSCDEHYLAGKMSSVKDYVNDYDKLAVLAKKEVLSARRKNDFSYCDARELYEGADSFADADELDKNLFQKIFDISFWEFDIPIKPNPDYVYLTSIITTIQQALITIQA